MFSKWCGSRSGKGFSPSLEDLAGKSTGSAGFIFLKLITKLPNLIGEGKVPEKPRHSFLGQNLSPA